MNRPNIPARPTVYKGIQMRSRLEADYAAYLDATGEIWEYESTCFGGPDGQWLPDFHVGARPGADSYVELKSAHLLESDAGESPFDVYDRVDTYLRQISIAWLSEPDANLQLVFWIYGGQKALELLGSKRDPSWLAFAPGPCSVPLVWPGMGQYEALADKYAYIQATKVDPVDDPGPGWAG